MDPIFELEPTVVYWQTLLRITLTMSSLASCIWDPSWEHPRDAGIFLGATLQVLYWSSALVSGHLVWALLGLLERSWIHTIGAQEHQQTGSGLQRMAGETWGMLMHDATFVV